MTPSDPHPTKSNNLDATLEATVAPPPLAQSTSGLTNAGRRSPCVDLVEGSRSPELTSETEGLLRKRLKLASIVILTGFSLFLVRGIVFPNVDGEGLEWLLFFHLGAMAVVAACTVWLHRSGAVSVRSMRIAEAVIFGVPMFYVALCQYQLAIEFASRNDFELEMGPWLVFISLYALLIPNTLRRASIIIGLIAMVPTGLLILLVLTQPQVAALATLGHMTGLPLMLILAAVGAVFGVDTIGTLRREAFEARQLGQYRLKERIGAGGMGEVYLAEHQLLKRPCVIKLIQPSKAGDPRVLARFQREVRATAKLTHWNSVEIFDYGSAADGTFYYVMEYLPGLSLAELVERFGPLPPERVIFLLRQVCDALNEAHSMGLIHRDIKPGNIFAAQRGGVYDVAKLLDFGLVKPLCEDPGVELTVEGAITGSPLYMSPEQATGESEPDARSDIYSIGAVAYFLLTGRPPFVGEKPIQVLIAHAREAVVPPSKVRSDVPKDLESLVLRCLAKTPADRFPSAASLESTLGECQAAGLWNRSRAAEWWQSANVPSCAHVLP
jgi:serine/threonine-protein kinase